MITALRSTIARKLQYQPSHGGKKRLIVVYLQPNGLLVFRKPRCRKRFSVSVAYVLEKALDRGPVEGLFAAQLQGRSKAKKKKPTSKKKSVGA